MTVVNHYKCDFCKMEYPTAPEAANCEKTHGNIEEVLCSLHGTGYGGPKAIIVKLSTGWGARYDLGAFYKPEEIDGAVQYLMSTGRK